ncbi:cytochrome P450 3A8-like isoform X2 [Pomacea canaliculata]|uniref:cytochrome P450 3A8-like isoform X2 n=1 Tax=Pomacea canaliculata TaxID=400727 RepID=UPI000D73F334|nr:cytochrome P450 3A8-like isoform X2 [Pomacea canaliculata]
MRNSQLPSNFLKGSKYPPTTVTLLSCRYQAPATVCSTHYGEYRSRIWLSLTSYLVVGVGTLTAIWLWRSCQEQMTFKRMGVPGPTPIPIIGNMLTILRKGMVHVFPFWNKQYGKIYGVFMPSPVLVINDLDLIKDIAIKQFQSFPNRKVELLLQFC